MSLHLMQRALWLIVAMLTWVAPACAARQVAVLLSDYSAPHLEILESLRRGLEKDGKDVSVVTITDDTPVPADAALIVAVGVRAGERLAGSNTAAPVLVTLVPRASFEIIRKHAAAHGHHEYSALFLDVPPRLQMSFLRQVLPEAKRIALLTGPTSTVEARAIAEAAREAGLTPVTSAASGPEDIYPQLQQILPKADALLALPDPAIYNGHTIQNILLTSYRFRIPLLSFSPAYVRAGALAAVYGEPGRIGPETLSMVRETLKERRLPPPRYPGDFTCSTNGYVANSLGIRLPDEARLKERLDQLERP